MSICNPRTWPWEPREDEILRSMWESGRTSGEIAERLPSRSRSSVMGRAHRLNLTRRSEPIEIVRARVQRSAPRAGREPAPTPVFRDPCVRCGVRGDIGCEHRR